MSSDSLALDFALSNTQAGFRLHHLEVFNWGTFDKQVWQITPNGQNSLLTGDIGSGKSTLVDAITTLLVPSKRITYNKAAGADSKERSLRSYVLGHYKVERGENNMATQAIALRDANNYSVILGHFYNEGYDQHITLAQVFWITDASSQPSRFYIVAQKQLSIAQDFDNFGDNINQLKKRLRKSDFINVFDSFSHYSADFRRRFGIDNAQALELFNQTISMKSVDNITQFVRQHMLEPFPMDERINNLIHHFDDLTRAHEAIVKARQRIESLTPLVVDLDQHQQFAQQLAQLTASREALASWFAGQKSQLLAKRLENLQTTADKLAHKRQTLEHKKQNNQIRRDELKQSIAQNGGDRLQRLKIELADNIRQKQQRQKKSQQYRDLATALELPDAKQLDTFLANQRQLDAQQEQLQHQQAEKQNTINELGGQLYNLNKEHKQLQSEIDSLKAHRSNIPQRVLAIREALCQALNLGEDNLPFAGELIQVDEKERDWEGAIERVLHNFGLSLLVPEALYSQVSEWVNRTHLRGRLVYFRVRTSHHEAPDLHPNSLVHKLNIQPDSDFYPWLEAQLAKRFNYACCDDLTDFRREKRAITALGQIKQSGGRHEKDDRHSLTDRSRYVLGWDNHAKLAAVEHQAQTLAQQGMALTQKLKDIQQQIEQLAQRISQIGQLRMFADFVEIDWQPLAQAVERLEQERQQLEAANNVLKALESQLAEVEQALQHIDQQLDQQAKQEGANQEKTAIAERLYIENSEIYEQASDLQKQHFEAIATHYERLIQDRKLTVESCDNQQSRLRKALQQKIDKLAARQARLRDRIISAMRQHQQDWPGETRDIDASLEAAETYRTMLADLQRDGLPRFEQRFKELLNENTIQEIAAFNTQLHQQRQLITERIDTINRSLTNIDYNDNRYIRILGERTSDQEIRQFEQDLRACTEGVLTGSEDAQYTEQKFLQVKAIIARFRGRDGYTDLDKRWTRKVTDIRHWFVFSASERWREDDAEYEHYSDSSGKSGGQKEKLAYTILAASLAYQFGLEWGEQRSRSFRFVVIDEAFGRGSDESARYGLELFEKLNLQLLIVTPLQKTHIIEPYIASVGFVHNQSGQQSMIRNLSIETFHAEKAARNNAKRQQPASPF